MPKVKILEIESRYDYDDYDGIRTASVEGLSDWEDISEEEYELLNKHLRQFTHGHGTELIIVRIDSVPIEKRILNIREELVKVANKEAEKLVKAKEAQDKRNAEAALKKEEKERKHLAALLDKYGNDLIK